MTENVSLKVVELFYGDDKAERTGIKYIQHIYEGVKVLQEIGANQETIDAYCLHPLYQMLPEPDAHPLIVEFGSQIDPHTILLAKEYKKTANAYLCKPHYRSIDDVITLSEFPEVNTMLIADKVQNRKDFEKHYESQNDKTVFSRSENLAQYFRNWLKALEISEPEYQRLKNIID